MRIFTFNLLISVICGMLTACGGTHAIQTAPFNQQQAGERFIVKGNSQELELLKNNSDGYRILNHSQGLIEVSGLNYTEIKTLTPGADATQNQYFENLLGPKKTAKSNLARLLANDQNVTTRQLPPALEGCDLSKQVRPTPMLKLSVGVLNPETITMELGNSIFFDGGDSLAVDQQNGSVEVRWEVTTPSSSLFEPTLRSGDQLEIQPDAMGLYQIHMVVKDDETHACNLEQFAFLVTANPEIEWAQPSDTKPMIDLAAFSHLPRVQAEQSWQLATGKGVTIAILDTGLNYNHLGIKFNLAINQAELNGQTGQDEDGNHLTDDVLGWDFINGDNSAFDDEGHGSHVAGLAASHIFGLAKDAKILPVKIMNAAGGGDLASIIAGVYYATDRGANVINASLQRLQGNIPALQDAIDYAHSKGVVFIASSGNDSLDLSLPENEIYPGEIDSPNLINVAAIGISNDLSSYSNFGQQETDIAVPGGDMGEPLYSLAPLNPRDMPFIGSSGTSMAAPVAAGIVAQMLEANPELKPEQVKMILMESGQSYDSLTDVVGSGKLLSAYEAVQKAKFFDIENWIL